MELDFADVKILAEKCKLFQVRIDLFNADDLIGFAYFILKSDVFHLDGAFLSAGRRSLHLVFLKVEVKGAIHRAFGDFDVKGIGLKDAAFSRLSPVTVKFTPVFCRRKRDTLRIDGKKRRR